MTGQPATAAGRPKREDTTRKITQAEHIAGVSASWRKFYPSVVAAIEHEARSQLLDELIAKVEGLDTGNAYMYRGPGGALTELVELSVVRRLLTVAKDEP